MITISIVLADDHAVVRQGLRSLLRQEVGYSIVGEAADGPLAIALVEQLMPDILVLDIMMPGMSGLEVIRQVRQRAPETRVVVLSMHADAVYVHEALRAGATGYVLKEASASELIEAVREAVQGRRYLSLLSIACSIATSSRPAPMSTTPTSCSPTASGRCSSSRRRATPRPRSPSAYRSARAPSRRTAPICSTSSTSAIRPSWYATRSGAGSSRSISQAEHFKP
jgi:DNA-binding NarL/FixJ family response regulator